MEEARVKPVRPRSTLGRPKDSIPVCSASTRKAIKFLRESTYENGCRFLAIVETLPTRYDLVRQKHRDNISTHT